MEPSLPTKFLARAAGVRMLKLTKIEGYAFQILTCIADSDPSALRSAKELALQVRLPLPTVSKILKLLTQNNILISHQGSKGGYMLTQPGKRSQCCRYSYCI